MDSLSRKLFRFKKTIWYNSAFLSSSVPNETFKFSDLTVELTKNPAKKPADPDKVLFGHVFTDHMLSVKWDSKSGWQKPHIEPFRNLELHPAAKVLHYSVEIFEGMKAYRCVDGKVRLFRPDMNLNRLYRSAVRSTLPLFDREELMKCLKKFVAIEKDWVPKSTKASLYIRPTFIGTEPTLGVGVPNEALLYIITSPCGPYFPTGFKPISLYADPAYVRAFHGGIGDCKAGSNYGPTLYVNKEAAKVGCQQVLWLYGEDHLITEAGTMNIFIVVKHKNGQIEIITPPTDGIILEGVTRFSILDIARKWKNVKVTERRIGMKEFVDLLENNQIVEAFGSGTACVVCPIERILYKGKNLKVPTMDTGAEYLTRLANELNDIQYGRVSSEWAVAID